MLPDVWNPDQYERFRREREQPFWDLLALVRQQHIRRAVDLGCGTGRLTAALHDALHADETLGLDSSRGMLMRARRISVPGLRFEEADIDDWRPAEPPDLMFSNAALHWVDDHERLLTRLTALLAPSGQLAVQVPANFDHPSHTIAAEVAGSEPFASALGGYTRVSPVLAPERYSELLHQLAFAEQIVRLQVYGHLLQSTAAVVEWVRGTLLTDYEVRLPASLYDEFLAAYRRRLLEAIGDQPQYFYAFKRILLWGKLGPA